MRARTGARGNEAGFTLVEAIIAGVLMLVGILGIMAALLQSYSTTKDMGRKSILNHMASEKIEELRSLDYTHADLAAGTHPSISTDADGAHFYPVAGYGDEYSLRWIVSAGPTDGGGSAEPNMKTVTVEATSRQRYTSGGAAIASTQSLETVLVTFVTN